MSIADELVQTALKHARLGRTDRALRDLEKALAADPDHVPALRELGLLLARHARPQAALERLRRAAKLRPDDVPTLEALGTVARAAGQLQESADARRRLIELADTEDPLRYNALAVVLLDQGKLDEAIALFRRALQLRPNLAAVHSNLLLCLNYHEAISPQELLAEHREFGRLHAPPHDIASRAPAAAQREGDPRLRIGYLSPDLGAHSVSFFLLPILHHHDRSRVRVTCYSDVRTADDVTALLPRLTEQWRDVSGLSDDDLARQIEQDGIDVLVELAGHTVNNRLPMLARRRIAPVQATYLGYPNTTGLANIDYRITDALADPPEMTDAQYTESLVRLPDAFFTAVPLSAAPAVAPLPAAGRGDDGAVTFAVVGNFAKVRPPMLRLWAQILAAVPRARLLMQCTALADPPTRDATARCFTGLGIDAARLDLRGPSGFQEFLQLFREVDVVLDTFPFNGHTTSYQALWMGAPLVTLAGESHRSRMGLALLQTIGLGELVAHDGDQYVRIATELAGDLTRLAALRSGMRQCLERSPILDAPRFVRNLEAAYAQMQRR